MEHLAREYLGFDGFSGEIKPVNIGRSNWERISLSRKQVIYATVDAYVSRRLGVIFSLLSI